MEGVWRGEWEGRGCEEEGMWFTPSLAQLSWYSCTNWAHLQPSKTSRSWFPGGGSSDSLLVAIPESKVNSAET